MFGFEVFLRLLSWLAESRIADASLLIVLSIQKVSLSGVDYYLELACEDYYLKGGEPPGQWHGKACAGLALKGEVEDQVFRNLFYGFSPDGAEALVKNAGHLDG